MASGILGAVGIAAAAAVVGILPAQSEAQGGRMMRHVTVERVARLIDSEGVLGGKPLHVSRARDGGAYLVIERHPNGEAPMLFSSDGRFLRKIGRRGSGPGEFKLPWFSFFGNDGRIHILDIELNRRSVFSAEGNLVQTSLLGNHCGNMSDAVLLADESIVMACGQTDAGSGGFALQEIDQSSRLVSLFEPISFDVRRRFMTQRVLHARANGEILSGDVHGMAISVHTPDRKSVRRTALFSDWAKPLDKDAIPSDGSYERPPKARLVGIWEDATAVWIAANVPSADWRPGPSLQELIKSGKSPAATERPRFDCIFEALDAANLQTLVQHRVPGGPCGYALGGGYFARPQIADDQASFDIVRVHITSVSEKP